MAEFIGNLLGLYFWRDCDLLDDQHSCAGACNEQPDFCYVIRRGSQTRGPHVAREGILCGQRCFLEFSKN